MGGCNSNRHNLDGEHNLNQYLTPKQVKIVQETWVEISKNPHATGIVIFYRLFGDHPEYRQLFPKLQKQNIKSSESNGIENGQSGEQKGENEEEEGDEFAIDIDALRRHAGLVMDSLGSAVDSLEHTDTFEEVLQFLGSTHSSKSVKPDMLKKIGPAIQYAIAHQLGDGYTHDVKEAWKKVLEFILVKMSEGMKHAEQS